MAGGELAPARLLVGHSDLPQHHEAHRLRAAVEQSLEVGVDEHHDRVDELLGHRELDLVELRALHLGLDGLPQVVRAMAEDLVDLLGVQAEDLLVVGLVGLPARIAARLLLGGALGLRLGLALCRHGRRLLRQLLSVDRMLH